MNNVRWSIFATLCLLLGAMPIAITKELWASVPQPMVHTPAQIQAVQVAVELLLYRSDPNTNEQSHKNYLPLIRH